MDLSYSKEEVAFRQEVREFFNTSVPAGTRKKLQEGRHLSKEDMVNWQRILNKKGWAVPHWPKAVRAAPAWTPVQHLHLHRGVASSTACTAAASPSTSVDELGPVL